MSRNPIQTAARGHAGRLAAAVNVDCQGVEIMPVVTLLDALTWPNAGFGLAFRRQIPADRGRATGR